MITFQNEGIVELRAFLTHGVSAKEGDNNIGLFGTGFKYAVAILLRHRCKVSLWLGMEEHVFGIIDTVIRGKPFQIITCDGNELSFTTHQGHTWELWQAYRELRCNAMDEGGETGMDHEPKDGHTTVIVHGADFDEVHAKRNEYFLSSTPIFAGKNMEIHARQGNGIFYQGVRVGDVPCLYTYNLTTYQTLTEDRTLKSIASVESCLEDDLARCTDTHVLEHVLTAPEGSVEERVRYTNVPESWASAEFRQVVERLERDGRRMNRSAVKLVDKLREKELTPADVQLTSVELAMFNKAKDILLRSGFTIEDYPIIILATVADGLMGQAKGGKIYVTKKAFAMGTKALAGTIYEEWLHLKTGHPDMTRALQNHLVDEVMSKCEEVLGEPM